MGQHVPLDEGEDPLRIPFQGRPLFAQLGQHLPGDRFDQLPGIGFIGPCRPGVPDEQQDDDQDAPGVHGVFSSRNLAMNWAISFSSTSESWVSRI